METDTQRLFKIEFSPKQMDAFNTINSDSIDELMYGGAKGGGKTVFGVKWVYYFAKWLIKFFDLPPTLYPPVLGFMGRKQAVDFGTTTLNTWKRDIPNDAYEIKEQKKLIVVEDCAAIQYGGLDDTETIMKFNSAEYAFWWLDQGEECSERDVGMLRGTMRLKLKGKTPPYKGLLTVNPAQTFLKHAFIDNPQPKTKYIQALPSDNPYLPSTYIDNLKKAFGYSPSLLNAYLYGAWDDLTGFDLLIQPAWAMLAKGKQFRMIHPIKKVVTIDVARYGDDKTVFYAIESSQDSIYRTIGKETHEKKSTMEIVGRAVLFAQRLGIKAFAVDEIGVGAGVVDRLKELGYQVIAVNSSEKSSDPEKFYNVRAEVYGKGAELFQDNKVSILSDDIELQEQLSWAKYKVVKSNGLIQIEAKDDIKKRYGRSPDNADAFLNGVWALRRVRPDKNPETSNDDKVGWNNGNYEPEWAQEDRRMVLR